MCFERYTVVEPITVSGVGDWRFCSFPEGSKFSVARIKASVDQGIGQIDVFVGFLGQVDTLDPTWRTMEYRLIETVAHAGLTPRTEVSLVLCLNITGDIHQDFTRR
jgi:hypothetical protein